MLEIVLKCCNYVCRVKEYTNCWACNKNYIAFGIWLKCKIKKIAKNQPVYAGIANQGMAGYL